MRTTSKNKSGGGDNGHNEQVAAPPPALNTVEEVDMHELFSAPVRALMLAEIQAAQSLTRFIQQMGFVETASNQAGGAQSDSTLGALRMVDFTYRAPGELNSMQNWHAHLPWLSMVPIPAIEIKDAEFEFCVQITRIESVLASNKSNAGGSPDGSTGSQVEPGGAYNFKVALGGVERQAQATGDQLSDGQMRVKIRVGQADVTSGLAYLFNVMKQSVGASLLPAPDKPES